MAETGPRLRRPLTRGTWRRPLPRRARHQPVRGWWRRRGIRARLTLAASAGLAVALAAAGLLLLNALRVSLTRGLDDTARQGAREVAVLADAHHLPNPVPVPAPASTLTIQVLNGQGDIIDASPLADRYLPLLPLATARSIARGDRALLLAGPPMGIPALLRVVAVATGHQGVVIAAVSYTKVSDSLAVATKAVLIGGPLLFLLLAAAVWLITGAALRPIEELRRGAQEITGTAIPRTLPAPEARDEVHDLAVTLNDMLDRLAAAQQRQRALVSDAAHELRSPIASIRTQLEVAIDHPQARDWQQTAADVLADTLRLAKLAEDLLALAKLDERAGLRPRGAPVDLTRLVREVSLRYAGARIPVTAGIPSGTGSQVIDGDAGGLDRMLVNLVDNAVRYARGSVRVTAQLRGGWAVLTVTDDGPGIPAGEAERVFDRFTRLDDARSRGPDGHDGSGLGLAIVRATAVAHGGSAWLEDAAPGLRAVVRLPAPPAGRLPAAPGQQRGDRDNGEQQGQVGDGQVEQPHRSR